MIKTNTINLIKPSNTRMIVYIATASAVVRPAKLKGKKKTYPSIQSPRNLHHIALMRYSGTSPSIIHGLRCLAVIDKPYQLPSIPCCYLFSLQSNNIKSPSIQSPKNLHHIALMRYSMGFGA